MDHAARLGATLTVAAALIGFASVTAAQTAFPSRPITIINPNAPGGFVDNVARGLALSMQKILKQPVLIVNRPGANGTIGHVAVANAAADGYTLLITANTFATQPAIDDVFERPQSYSLAKFITVAQITADPAILLVHPGMGVKTIQEFVARARATPDGVIIASSGTYGASHLPMAMLESTTGIKFRHVPTSGGAPAMTLTLGGHVNAMAAPPSLAFPQVQANRLIPLAQSGPRRLPPFMDVPTFKESNINLEFSLWTALFAPAGVPPAIMKTISDAVRQAAADEQFRASMAKGHSTVVYMDGEEFATAFRADVKRHQDTVRQLGKINDAPK